MTANAAAPTDGQIGVQIDDRVAWLTLDRPAKRNALTTAMLESLQSMICDIARRDDIDIIVLRGSGVHFCAGSDLGDIASIIGESAQARKSAFAHEIRMAVQPLTNALLGLEQPLIVSARGHAVGMGALFVLVADLIALSDTCTITMPQVRLGHTLDHGESWLLPRRIGLGKATQLCMLGEGLSAADAERFGLANWVIPDNELDSHTASVVAKLRSIPPIALLRTKALMRSSCNLSFSEQLDAEVDAASSCAATDDFVEAVTAQIEKRTPSFKRS
jgi:2-(1,2-epoxy-1,2-dihydrophenyl)acetyl-CoA isomerase